MPEQQQHRDNHSRLDRIERLLEHLAEAQAKHEAGAEARLQRGDERLNHLLEAQTEHGTRLDRIEGNIEKTVGLIRQLAEHADKKMAATDERIRQMSEETDRRFRETDERFRQTEVRFRETDERLNALIKILDGVIRKRPPQAPSA